MEKDIGKLTKNDTTEIILRIDDFGGRKGLTIREFVTSDRYTGFTKSGVRIPASDFKKFKDFINSIDESDLKESEPSGSGGENSGEGTEKPKSQKTLGKQQDSEELPDY